MKQIGFALRSVLRENDVCTKDFPIVVSSDAHFLEEVGRNRTRFLLKEITVEEMGKSFRGEAGRRVVL